VPGSTPRITINPLKQIRLKVTRRERGDKILIINYECQKN